MTHLCLEIDTRTVAGLSATDRHVAAQLDPRYGEDRTTVRTRKRANVLFATIQQVDRTLTDVVDANGETEELALRVDVADTHDALLDVLGVERRHGRMMRDLLGDEAQVAGGRPGHRTVFDRLRFSLRVWRLVERGRGKENGLERDHRESSRGAKAW